jgi:hypothetical protein
MQEKAPYVSKAEKLKAEYTKKMDAYNNKQVQYARFQSTHVARQCLEIRLCVMWVMCHLLLQSGGPTASGDSDKSKSEVNDEDEEVRESKAS